MILGNSKSRWSILLGFLAAAPACNSGGGSHAVAPPAPLPPVGVEIIASTNPAPGAIKVPLDADVTVHFAVPMAASDFTPATLALYQGANQIAGSVSSDGVTATFTPASKLPSDIPMRAVLAAGVKTAAGQALDQEFAWTFDTEDSIPIQIVSHFPATGQGSVPLSPQIVMDFSEDIAPGSVLPSSFQLVGPLGPVPGQLTLAAARQLLFTPLAALKQYTDYTATVSGITDLSGNAINPPYSWTFRTIDLGPPTVVSTIPVVSNPMAMNVPVDVVITVQFSEPMNSLSVGPATLTLVDSQGASVAGSVLLDPISSTTLTFTPSAALKDGKVHTATLSGAITDLAGNPLGANLIWSFKTVAFQHGSFGLVETNDAGNADTPSVVVDPNTGEALAVWRQQLSAGGTYAAYGSFYHPATQSWDTPTCFENSFVNQASEPSVAWDPVGVVGAAVWVQQINADTSPRVQLIVYYFGYWDTFSVLTLSTQGATASNPRIAFNQTTGNFDIIWQENNSTATPSRSIYACQFNAPFFSATAPILLDSSGTTNTVFYYKDLGFALDSASGIGYAVWSEQNAGGGAYNLYALAHAPQGWDTNSVLLESELNTGNNSNNLDNPMVAVDPATKDGLFVWRQKLGNQTQAKAFRAFFQRLRYNTVTRVYSYPGCANPSAPCMIQLDQDSTNAVLAPRIAADSAGNALAVWAQNVPASSATMPGDGFSSIYSVAFAPGSSVPGAIKVAETQAVNCNSPQIVSAGLGAGSFYLVLVESVSGTVNPLRLNAYSNGAWASSLLPLEPPAPPAGASSANPAIVTRGAGIGLCLWERNLQGGVKSVVFNQFP